MQDRLGLIIGRVRGDDKACPHAPCHRFQRGISSPACRGLDPLAVTIGKIDGGRGNFACQPQLLAKVYDESLVGLRSSTAQLMIHVGANQPSLAGLPYRGQSAEQGDAIATSGNRRQNGQVFPVLRRP